MSEKIVVQGNLHIGRELELVQAAERLPAKASFFDSGRPNGMAPVDYTPRRADPGELSMVRLGYSLKETSRKFYIKDDGLTASYGIFGAPRSGKTYLVMYLLEQILALHKDQPELKYGGLILDPKGVLINDIRQMLKKLGRQEDLVVLNTDELNDELQHREAVNVINSGLDPYELGKQLVLAAQSAGVATSDPYWTLSWENLFGPALYLLSLGNNAITVKDLLDAILTVEPDISGNPERRIQSLARQWSKRLDTLEADKQQDTALAISQVEEFFSQKDDSVGTIKQIINSAYGRFLRSHYRCYSRVESKELAERSRFYDQPIEEGKIILVSLSPNEPEMAKILCTLVKCLFQRSVLSRLDGRFKNRTRPLIFACDEYAQIATELPGKIGDGDFFSQAAQFGCMGLLATQSVNILQASSLKENWRAVFSTFGAKFFMRAVDQETAEEAAKLAGEYDWNITSQGTSRSKDGIGSSTQKDIRERKALPIAVLTQVFNRGDAVILGSLDGAAGQSVRFVHVQKDSDTS